MTLAAVAMMLTCAGPAAASSLSWSAPTLVDHQPPFGGPAAYSGVSCPTASFCVAVGWAGDGIGNIATSSDPTGGPTAWKVVSQVDNSSLLFDVSCPSTTLCVGIDVGGDVVTSTDPTGGANAWTVTRIDNNYLDGVSCPSTSLCVVTDNSGNVLTSTDPTGGASAWTTTNVTGYGISAVSCPSVSLCVAAVHGGGDVATSTNPTGGAGAWRVVHVDTAGTGDYSVQAISCPSASLCVAGDNQGNIISSTNPTGGAGAWHVVEVYGPTTWGFGRISCASTSLCVAVTSYDGKIFTSTNPTGSASSWTAATLSLSGVDCPSESLCVAGDGYGNIVTATDPTGGAGAWSFAHVGLGVNAVNGISCPSASLCVGADSGGNVVTSTDPAGGGAWSFAHVDGDYRNPNTLTAVSCPSALLCVGVDQSGNVASSTNPTGGAGTWSTFGVDVGQTLSTISCPAATLCVAAGDPNGNVATSTNPTGGASAWTVTHIDNAPAGLRYISGVSCPTASLCVAVDGAGDVLWSTNPTGGSAAWTTITNVSSGPGLLGVSCASATLCVAVGYAGTVVASSNPTGGAGAWTAATVDSSQQLAAVSCPATTLCVAGDAAGNVVTSTNPTGGAAAWTAASVDPGNGISAVACPSTTLCLASDVLGDAIIGQPPKHTLTVSKTGTGSGTVTSPSGIDCGATCSQQFDQGTPITLTATPASGSTFAGWSSGGCSGTGTCQVTINADTTVTATFTAITPPPSQRTLTVTLAGTGSGSVTGPGISCVGACSHSYDSGTIVTLTAAPASGSIFTGWSGGGCGGTGSCTVTMSSDQMVTATFTATVKPPQAHTLTVSLRGTGSGRVTGTGINCPGSCSDTYTNGTIVTLTATPASGSAFSGWSGGVCTGTRFCTVTMSSDQTVTATLTALAPSITEFKLTNTRFAVSRKATAISAAAAKRGTTIRYKLSLASTAKIVIKRRSTGRVVGTACVRQTKRNARHKKCTLYSKAGTLTRKAKKGSNTLAFSGRIGRTALAPASYRATITARVGKGPISKPRSATFTILRG